jgi:hypothetical protein
MSSDPFAPIGAGSKKTATAKPPKGTVVMPVPADAPTPPAKHPTLGKPTAVWRYNDAAGRLLGYACRFDGTSGKQFRPLTLWQLSAGGPQWRWESWPEKRPLYGLPQLADRPTAPVLIVEGEKAADAATRLLPGVVVVTSPNGSKSAGKADWSPLKAREVTIWPDADAAGYDYARAVAKLVTRAGAEFVSTSKDRGRGAEVSVSLPPPGVADGWDAADALAEGWTTERAAELVAATVPADQIPEKRTAEGGEETTGGAPPGGGRKRPAQRDVLIGLTEFVELWHDAGRTAYSSFPVNGHVEHWPIMSESFRNWLSDRYFEETGTAIGGQGLEDGLRILKARAVIRGPQFETFLRIGEHEGKQYLDLCDDAWRAVEIATTGWRVIEKPPLKLMRSPAMRSLPEPEGGYTIEEFRGFVMGVSDDEFMLMVSALVAAMRPRGPFPVLVLTGEQDSGKSVACKMMRLLVDPSAAPIRAVPKDDRDFLVSALNSWMLSFDNLSSVPAWLSDAFCRMSTGGGFATRRLHTDFDEAIFEAQRPVTLNGIGSLADRADLASRTVHHSPSVDVEDRPTAGRRVVGGLRGGAAEDPRGSARRGVGGAAQHLRHSDRERAAHV